MANAQRNTHPTLIWLNCPPGTTLRKWPDSIPKEPGTLVRFAGGGGYVQLLGDLNLMGGLCDCCADHADIVEYSTTMVEFFRDIK